MALRDEMLDLLRRDPAFRDEVRRQLLTEELLGLPAVVRELAERMARLAERVDQLAERMDQLAERMGRLVERVGQLVERMGQLAEAQRRTEERLQQLIGQVDELRSWQRGEAGRRTGERFEREVRDRAPTLFHGGRGGAPGHDWVRERLAEYLLARPAGALLAAEEDPFLADLVWWKGEQVVVVEASLQVNGTDVARAAARAATLSRAGARAVAVVIGEAWARPDTARQAEALGVEWKVGDELSPGFLALRRAA